MTLTVEASQQLDGRWFAEVPQLPGVHAHAATRDAATESALSIAYRMLEAEQRAGIARGDSAEVYGRESERVPSVAVVS